MYYIRLGIVGEGELWWRRYIEILPPVYCLHHTLTQHTLSDTSWIDPLSFLHSFGRKEWQIDSSRVLICPQWTDASTKVPCSWHPCGVFSTEGRQLIKNWTKLKQVFYGIVISINYTAPVDPFSKLPYYMYYSAL